MNDESTSHSPPRRRTLLHPRYVPTWPFALAAALIPVAFLAALVLAGITVVVQRQYLTALVFAMFIPVMAALGYAFTVVFWHTARTQKFPVLPIRLPCFEALHRAAMLVFVQVFALAWCGGLVAMVVLGIRDVIQKR